MRAAAPVTPDGRYIVVRGRLWRRSNPHLPEAERQALVTTLMAARRAVRAALAAVDPKALAAARARMQAAKAGGLVAAVVAAQVRSDHPVAGGGQRADLAAPCPPKFGKTVQQQDRRSLGAPSFDDLQCHLPGLSPPRPPAGL